MLRKNSHTPGPWHVEPDHANRFYIADETGECTAKAYFGEPDARLIAAAPELLAALQDLLPLAECYDRDMKAFGDRVAAARAAIAKATVNTSAAIPSSNEPKNKVDIPVTLRECRRAIEEEIRDPDYLLFLLDWATKEI